MKKIFILIVISILSISYCKARVLSEQIYFDNDKLRIYIQDEESTLTNIPYSHVWIYFSNKTNNRIKVNYEAEVRFINGGDVKDIRYKQTIIIGPNSTCNDYSARLDPSLAHKSPIILLDFKLINYAVEKINYETEW